MAAGSKDIGRYLIYNEGPAGRVKVRRKLPNIIDWVIKSRADERATYWAAPTAMHTALCNNSSKQVAIYNSKSASDSTKSDNMFMNTSS